MVIVLVDTLSEYTCKAERCVRDAQGATPQIMQQKGAYYGQDLCRRKSPVKGQGSPSFGPSLGSQGRLSKLSSSRCQPNCHTNPSRLIAIKTNEMVMLAISRALVLPACKWGPMKHVSPPIAHILNQAQQAL